MTEKDWVKSIIGNIETGLRRTDKSIRVTDGHRLPYSSEILNYKKNNSPDEQHTAGYETDILVFEQLSPETWKPRIVIETKLEGVTTHDAITYSQKAQTHKYVHPYLRYGILIGDREHYPLPGRLFRHGQHFDFMLSWRTLRADRKEFRTLLSVLRDEIEASRQLDEIIFNSRSSKRKRFTALHRPLRLN